jgi:endo-1,4-beta-D-glucanase Y
MAFERRTILVSGLLFALPGCAGALPAAEDKLVGWADFKARFVQPDGRVVDTGNGGISHSEGQGYAMVLAEVAGDRRTFDTVWAWTEATLALPDLPLFAWRYDPRRQPAVDDPNNATDGDILIAWALLRASRRWKDTRYAERSHAIRASIASSLTRSRGGRTILLPGRFGFEQPDRTTINLSYYVWPALDEFRAADGAAWALLIEHGEALLSDARFGPYRLPTDWNDVDARGAVVPAAGKPARFGFDAIRIPLYLALGGRPRQAADVAGFWRERAAAGRPIPAWIDVLTGEEADFALSRGGARIAQRVLGRSIQEGSAGPPDYYSATLSLLARL